MLPPFRYVINGYFDLFIFMLNDMVKMNLEIAKLWLPHGMILFEEDS